MRTIQMILVFGVLAVAAAVSAQSAGSWPIADYANLRAGGNGAPTERYRHTSVWTGTLYFVFGGQHQAGSQTTVHNNGGLYDPAVDAWLSRPNLATGIGPPCRHAGACWTGQAILVWGGVSQTNAASHNTGFMYDPNSDSVIAKPNLEVGVGAPMGAAYGAVHWTGDRMLVFGGITFIPGTFAWDPKAVFEGGIYDPTTDTWEHKPSFNAEVPFEQHNTGCVLAGDVFYSRSGGGGVGQQIPASNGHPARAGRIYDIRTDTWLSSPILSSGSAPVAIHTTLPSVVWTGELVLEYGGTHRLASGGDVMLATGRAYSIDEDVFKSRPSLDNAVGAPSARAEGGPGHWTGSHLWAWGGLFGGGGVAFCTDGGLYDPVSDSWSLTTLVDAPLPRGHYASAYTGDRVLGWGGLYKYRPDPNNPSHIVTVYHDNGFVFLPPRVAPTVRNLSAAPSAGKPNGDVGASAANPLRATFGVPFKHRIVCYGTPEAALISLDRPSWLQIGFGGPGSWPAAGTSVPFNPWYSSNGGTADGQWLRGTPDASATGLHSFTIHAHNGVFPDSATYTVWIDVEGPPVWDDNSIISGPPETIARSGVDYSYYPQTIASPAATNSVSGLPSWATWVGFGLHGTPTAADEYTVSQITVTATNTHGNISRNYYLTVLPPRPLAPGTADVNSDGDVNVLDVQKTINILLALEPPSFIPHPTEPPPAQLLRGDIDGNGVVNVVDIQALVNAILGQ